MRDTILIVDDEKDLLIGLQRAIAMDIDCDILVADNSAHALKLIGSEPVDVLLTDVCMPRMDGIELLKAVKNSDPHVTVIMMTAYGTIEAAVKAIKAGAYDFIQKPFREDDLIHLIRKGFELNRLVRENARLMARVCERAPFENIVGKSAAITTVLETIQTLAQTDVTVLIIGETGTGKDLAARALHAASKRRNRSMVTVNCPALPETILESELFGYRKGAFTDAGQDKPGLFDRADGGTIFLDEIGDLPIGVQTKLLRVLQDRIITPLGGTDGYRVDVRIVAATNQDLQHKINTHRFRSDLYFRLKVATVNMPPLKDLREDIPLLVEHFLAKAACQESIPPKSIAPEVLDYLMQRDWPGNIRELENTILNWTALIPGDVIALDDIPRGAPQMTSESVELEISKPYKQNKSDVIERFTIKYLDRLLTHTRGNVTLSAQISGIKRQSLQKIIKRYGFSVDRYRH